MDHNGAFAFDSYGIDGQYDIGYIDGNHRRRSWRDASIRVGYICLYDRRNGGDADLRQIVRYVRSQTFLHFRHFDVHYRLCTVRYSRLHHRALSCTSADLNCLSTSRFCPRKAVSECPFEFPLIFFENKKTTLHPEKGREVVSRYHPN